MHEQMVNDYIYKFELIDTIIGMLVILDDGTLMLGTLEGWCDCEDNTCMSSEDTLGKNNTHRTELDRLWGSLNK